MHGGVSDLVLIACHAVGLLTASGQSSMTIGMDRRKPGADASLSAKGNPGRVASNRGLAITAYQRHRDEPFGLLPRGDRAWV